MKKVGESFQPAARVIRRCGQTDAEQCRDGDNGQKANEHLPNAGSSDPSRVV
jgi:hypothetical protein